MEMRLPHEIKSEETKQKILTATENMLSRYDFKYLTVRNICEEAGVAYGSFYHHFNSKENLLHSYALRLFQENLRDNPIPDWIAPDDYIKRVLWYVEILGFFCETAGKDLMGYIYKNCPQELFEDTLQKEIQPILRDTDAKGNIDHFRNKENQLAVDLLIKDTEIICKGTLMWWACLSEDDAEPLHETLEHLCFNLLFAYSSDQYRATDYPHVLLTESPQFEGTIKIHGVPSVGETLS